MRSVVLDSGCGSMTMLGTLPARSSTLSMPRCCSLSLLKASIEIGVCCTEAARR